MSPQPDREVLIIGGDRHGERVRVLVGANAWVDIRTGNTHRVASLQWGVTDPDPRTGLPVVTERYVLKVAIHPQVQEHPAAMAVAEEAVKQLAMTEYMRNHAEPRPPDAAPPIPDTPAPLFGPDGRAM